MAEVRVSRISARMDTDSRGTKGGEADDVERHLRMPCIELNSSSEEAGVDTRESKVVEGEVAGQKQDRPRVEAKHVRET